MPDSTNSTTELRADSLSFAYNDRTIVRDFSLSLVPGDLTVLLGPNGSGKSTILQLLAGRLIPQIGDILLNGSP
ncbi:MAG: ABC transporter ATP-binding protein, partial [Victivallales bacterium]|nr:ABC transporter ATP-binding protein [Victivallales bacterium]